MPERAVDEPTLALSVAKWNSWLATHHDRAKGALVLIGKKGGKRDLPSYAEALEVALAWGWIDGQKRAHDDSAWIQRFTPRRPRSPWSKINREKAEALIKAGKMQPAGLAEVERAKHDGRWDAAYDSMRTSEVPEALATALAANEKAATLFGELDSANRYAILYRVQTAKKEETRARRIATLVAMLARGETLHPRRTSRKPPRR